MFLCDKKGYKEIGLKIRERKNEENEEKKGVELTVRKKKREKKGKIREKGVKS